MKIRIFAIASALSLLSAAAWGQPYKTEIKVAKGEKWWGPYACAAISQPFEEPFSLPADDAGAGRAISMLLSNNGRYVWSDRPFGVDFDGETITVTSADQRLNVEKAGRTLREAYLVCAHKNFRPQGSTPGAELFSQPVYETAHELRYAMGDNEVVAYAEKLLEEGFPAGVIVIGDGWRSVNDGYRFDPELWPDPQAAIDRLHELGFKVILTVSGTLPEVGRNFIRASESGLLTSEDVNNADRSGIGVRRYAMDSEGVPEMIDQALRNISQMYTFDGYRFAECSVSASAEQYAKLAAEKKWFDMTARAGMKDVAYSSLYRPFDNYITPLPGSAKSATQTLTANFINAGLLGLPYIYTEPSAGRLSGDQRADAAYLILQAALPVMSVEFAPWQISDPTLYEAVKDAFAFRKSLAEYMGTLVRESGTTAEPLVRHMDYQFPRQGFADCDDQFMLGARFLIAPAPAGAAKRMVRLPRGTWTARNGQKIRGPLVTEVDCQNGKLIYFMIGDGNIVDSFLNLFRK